MSSQSSSDNYYLPQPSHWPIVAATAMLFLGFGASLTVNSIAAGGVLLGIGFLILFFMFAGWFTTVAHESEAGKFNKQVDLSFRWGMAWFIFSEVMFFAAFFGVLFYMRVISVPDLGSLEHQQLLWPNFKADWPVSGPGIKETFSPMGAWEFCQNHFYYCHESLQNLHSSCPGYLIYRLKSHCRNQTKNFLALPL